MDHRWTMDDHTLDRWGNINNPYSNHIMKMDKRF